MFLWRCLLACLMTNFLAESNDGFMNASHHNFTNFFKDFALSLEKNKYAIVSGNNSKLTSSYVVHLNKILSMEYVSTFLFSMEHINKNDSYFQFLKKSMEDYEEVNTIFICESVNCEKVIAEIKNRKFIRRSLLYIFYWGDIDITKTFINFIHEAMRIVAVTKPKPGLFRIFYNQASPRYTKFLTKVNWWSGRLYKSPALPSSKIVYDNFEGKVFKIPVLHVPPWHFVSNYNDTAIEVIGGRDHQLLKLLAMKLNFRYEYFNPSEHSQGSKINSNGSFNGVLGLIYRREADFFLGDVSVTWERLEGVEFSFFTLADSGAFLTHAPRRLSEALALLRPFTWEVWPAVLASVVVSGPALWATAAGTALWRPKRYTTPSLSRCVWFTTSIFLRQTGRLPSEKIRVRALTLLLSLAATYVLGDVYSATLTSLLARPAREQPLTDLFALERAMKHNDYSLYVEKHSSSLTILQNGTGVYGRLWDMMRTQSTYLVRSVEQGVRNMLQNSDRPMVLLAGRETLYFDTKRFGASNFQLSEKLYTRYSSIAFQLGCPYIENFNKVLMQLFEAGILTKITSEEYEKLGEKGADGSAVGSSTSILKSGQDGTFITSQSQQKLEPVNMRMLQGAFYVLIFGYVVSGLTLIGEIRTKKRNICIDNAKYQFNKNGWNFRKHIMKCFEKMTRWIRIRWDRARALSELSLEYIE